MIRRRSRTVHSRVLAIAGWAVLAAVVPAAGARAAVCYQLPFPNPNLDDGWGSTCCGRTSPHRGVDFPQATGTAIPAVADGTVVVNTWSNCLGNVVVVQHADGMFSGYCHMSSGSPLGPGTPVAIGQQVGQVGATGTCVTGPHLHLTMSDHVDGWGSGTTVDPYAYIQNHLTCNDPPQGNLDSADCQGIVGWTQDPSAPDAAIAAHVYFGGPASDPSAIGVPLVADLYRDDLCMALGSCEHGFNLPVPLSLRDGAAREVHAYGIDFEGSGNNPELAASPLMLACGAPDVDGAKRRIVDPSVLTAWQFSEFDDQLTVDDATLAAFESTIDLPFKPSLAIPDDGSGALWLIDGVAGERRRRVNGPDVIHAWRLDIGVVTVMPTAELLALAEAPPLRARPILVKGSGEDVFLLDERIDPVMAGEDSGSDSDEGSGGDPPTSGSDPSGGSSSASSSEGEDPGATEDAGCGCRSDHAAWPGALMLVLLARPRRRRR